MSEKLTRRKFVRDSLSTAGALSMSAAVAGAPAPSARGAETPAAGQVAAPQSLPMGKLGDLEVSRILLGGNLLTHYAHSRDLRYVYALTKHYNTDEKILETLATAEQHGINTLVIHNVPAAMETLKKHRERGGKMQWITCTAHALANGDLQEFSRQIEELVAHGTDALYISGVEADRLCGFHKPIYGPDTDERSAEPKHDLLAQAVAICKSHGLPTGVGAHRMGVIVDCEQAHIEADFYVKTFHDHNYASVNLNHDSQWCSKPSELAAFMQNVEKPWFAFKVMAAGAIPPQHAFRYAFDNGADFCLAGMFDFEIEEDVRIANQVLATCKRTRPWRA